MNQAPLLQPARVLPPQLGKEAWGSGGGKEGRAIN